METETTRGGSVSCWYITRSPVSLILIDLNPHVCTNLSWTFVAFSSQYHSPFLCQWDFDWTEGHSFLYSAQDLLTKKVTQSRTYDPGQASQQGILCPTPTSVVYRDEHSPQVILDGISRPQPRTLTCPLMKRALLDEQIVVNYKIETTGRPHVQSGLQSNPEAAELWDKLKTLFKPWIILPSRGVSVMWISKFTLPKSMRMVLCDFNWKRADCFTDLHLLVYFLFLWIKFF